jgi:transcriptional regulator with XRE-family HTH domain
MSRKLPTVQAAIFPIVQEVADLGLLVRNQRAQLGLRIDDAAALCGVSSDVLSRLENGKPVTTNKLMLILNGLGMRLFTLPIRRAIALTPLLNEMMDGSE